MDATREADSVWDCTAHMARVEIQPFILSVFGNYAKLKYMHLIFCPASFIYLRLWKNQRCLLYQVQVKEVFKEIIQNQKLLSNIFPWTSINQLGIIFLSSLFYLKG